ncbi:hypothetical protein AXI59_11755 [Bacillus nakamurai]|uniref:hypothetical protein n=1 Tax=Bacillus nakamurai TaxID=1793963 RepID=UPI0007783467|nr:hypothetical protein [Bacillus nakamurai]KXZ21922.1 hypothetical protein AXI59_11755 [Bacillus nakamurai]
MSRLYKQNKTADDPEVQRIAAQFVKLAIILSPESADLEKYASLEKPSYFSGGFPEGFEEFIIEASVHLAEQEER